MAELVNPLGKIRGKLGNVIGYVGPSGKNYCRSKAIHRKVSSEAQKRQSTVFATVTTQKRWLAKAIREGFPGGNGYPKGFNGFTSVNAVGVVAVEKIENGCAVNRRKKSTSEFRGRMDYSKLRVAAGGLQMPVVRVEVNVAERKVAFSHEGIKMESYDCFVDDRILLVILGERQPVCRVEELCARGETVVREFDFPEYVESEDLIIYVFAKSADGRDTSDSVCLWKPEDRREEPDTK